MDLLNNVLGNLLNLLPIQQKEQDDRQEILPEEFLERYDKSTLDEQQKQIRGKLNELYIRQHQDPHQIQRALEALKQRRVQGPEEARRLALDAKGSAAAIAKETRKDVQSIRSQSQPATSKVPSRDQSQDAEEMNLEEERKRREKQKRFEQRREQEQADHERQSRLRQADDKEEEGRRLKDEKRYHEAIGAFDKALRIRIHGGCQEQPSSTVHSNGAAQRRGILFKSHSWAQPGLVWTHGDCCRNPKSSCRRPRHRPTEGFDPERCTAW